MSIERHFLVTIALGAIKNGKVIFYGKLAKGQKLLLRRERLNVN